MPLLNHLAFYDRMNQAVTLNVIDGPSSCQVTLAQAYAADTADAMASLALATAHRLLVGTSMRELQPDWLARSSPHTLLRQLVQGHAVTDAAPNSPDCSAPETLEALRHDGLRYLQHHRDRPPCPLPFPEQMQLDIIRCQNIMAFTAAQNALFQFALVLDRCAPVQTLVAYYGDVCSAAYAQIVASVTDISADDILAALKKKRQLRDRGLRQSHAKVDTVPRMLRLDPSVADLLLQR